MRRFSKLLSVILILSVAFTISTVPQKKDAAFADGAEDAAYKFADPELERAVRDEIIARTPLVVTFGTNKPLNAEKVYAAAHAPITNKQVANLHQLSLYKKYKIKTYRDLRNFTGLDTLVIEKENVNKSDLWSSIKDLEGLLVLTVIDKYYTDLTQLFQTKAKDTIACISIDSMDKKMLLQLKNMKNLTSIYSENNRKIEDFDGVELPYQCTTVNMGNSALKNIDGLRKYPLNTLIVSGKNLEINDPSFKKDYYGAAVLSQPYLDLNGTKFAEGIKNKRIIFPSELEERIFRTAIDKKTDAVLTYGDVLNTYEISLNEAKLKKLNLTQEQKEQFITHYLQRTDFIPPGLNICDLSIDVEALYKKGIVNEKNVNYLVLLEEQIPTEYLYNVENSNVGNENLDRCKIKIFHPDPYRSSFLSDEYYNKMQHYALLKAMKRKRIEGYMEKVENTEFTEKELLEAKFAHIITSVDLNHFRSNIQSKIQKGEYTKQRAEEEEKKLGAATTERIVKYMRYLGLQASSFLDENGVERIKFTVKGKEYICDYDKFTDLRSFGITPETAHQMTKELAQYTTDYESILFLGLKDIAYEERDYYSKTDTAKPKKTLDEMDFFKVEGGF